MAQVGSYIHDKYEVLKLIGHGGMSEVYLAMDKNLNKQWAIKEIRRRSNDETGKYVMQSALAEANMMKKLDHPCLPRIVDIINNSDVIYVVMDYIEGEPLSRIIHEEGAQPQSRVMDWAKSLCDVLRYLHSQNPPIIYRDMKPGNIMLQPNGNVKLIDFGIAREYKENKLEDTVILGTRGYAAPEQFGGKGQTDARTDIYSLGVTLYYLLTGKNPAEPPYEIYPIRVWNPSLSAGIEHIIEKCTESDPGSRYQSAEELAYALEHYEEDDDVYRRMLARKLSRFFVAAMITLLALGVGFYGMYAGQDRIGKAYAADLTAAEGPIPEKQRMEYYVDAINLKPKQRDAYDELIRLIKSDAVFTIEEEECLRSVIYENMDDLRQCEAYPEIAYEVGKLYWYYYDYGRENDNTDNDITRMTSAIRWYDDACTYGDQTADYYHISEVYSSIGCFHRDITILVEEAEDRGIYEKYYHDMMEMLDSVREEESEIICLETYRIVLYSMETYMHKFLQEGISVYEIRNTCEEIEDLCTHLNTTTDKSRYIKEEIMEQIPDIEMLLDMQEEQNVL